MVRHGSFLSENSGPLRVRSQCNSTHEVLINPYGLFYSEITKSNLLKIDLDGRITSQPDPAFGVNHAGYIIHSAVHAARPDVVCVLHTHTRAGVAVSAMDCGLLPVTQPALRFQSRLSYHDYQGPSVAEEERIALVHNLGQNDAMILRNHGLLTCGRSVGEAFLLMFRLEVACQIQVDLMSSGAKLIYPPEAVQARTADILAPAAKRDSPGRLQTMDGGLEWRAIRRLLDQEEPSYRN